MAKRKPAYRRAGPDAPPAPLAPPPPRQPLTAARWLPWLILAVTLLVFARVIWNDFGPVDDPSTISENPKLNPPNFTAEGVWWFWLHPFMGLYVPVTYLIWGLLAKATWIPTTDGRGLDARAFHAASLVAHTLSALMVYAVLRQLLKFGVGSASAGGIGRQRDGYRRGVIPSAKADPTRSESPWPAAAAALLFALHPLQVEAVAWTSGLKDLLYALFSLMALYLYLRAAQPGAEGDQSLNVSPRSAYVLGIVCMIIGMLCKPTAMVTPLIALIIDRLIVRRSWRQVIIATTPWFLAALPLAIVAKVVQPAAGIPAAPLWGRPILMGSSLSFYLWKLFVPTRFAFDYGWQPLAMLQKKWFLAIAIIPAALAIVCWPGRNRSRWPAAAGLVSIAALLPVLGFVPFLFQYYSTVADHYAYLAMLGPAMAVGWLLARVPAIWHRIAAGGAAIVLALLAALSFHDLSYWRTPDALLARELQITPNSLLGHNGLGKLHERRGAFKLAEREYLRTIALDPAYLPPRENLVSLYSYEGRAQEAIDQLHALMDIHTKLPAIYRQDYSGAFFEVGQLTLSLGRYGDAVRYFEEDIRLKPNHREGQEALARAREKLREASTRPAH
jgi:tetratricopeptide (TPR) repeat protein